MKCSSIGIVAAIVFAVAASANAALIRVEGQGQLIRGDLTLNPQSVESANLRHLREGEQVVLGANLTMDVDGTPMTWTGTPSFPSPSPQVLAGTSVNSHLIHFDPVGSPGSANATATFTFDSDVLGVIFSNENIPGAVNLLTNSDGPVGLGTTTYNNSTGRRTLRTGEATDVITISADSRSVTVTQVVGGANFDELRIITASNGLPVPKLEYNASIAAPGNSIFDSVRNFVPLVTTTVDYTYSGVTHTTTLGATAFDGIFAAYVFDGNDSATIAASDTLQNNIPGDPTNNNASFEIVFRPSDFVGQEVLFEYGGSGDGLSLTLSGHQLLYLVKNGGNDANVKHLIFTNDFVHAIGVVDLTNDLLSLYVDGVLVAQTTYTGNDWAGTGGEGFGSIGAGGVGGQDAGGGLFDFASYGTFQGDIALLRFYESALDAQQVDALFKSLHEPVVPEPATASLVLLGLAMLRRRRARA